MIKVRWKKDLKPLDRFEQKTYSNAQSLVLEAAEVMANDMRSHWSPHSPSSPGSAPAVVSGTLDESITYDETGRNELGQFAAGKDVYAAFVRIGAYYAGYLEDGTSIMQARPFIEPAIHRLEAVLPGLFSDIFK